MCLSPVRKCFTPGSGDVGRMVSFSHARATSWRSWWVGPFINCELGPVREDMTPGSQTPQAGRWTRGIVQRDILCRASPLSPLHHYSLALSVICLTVYAYNFNL